MRKMNKRGQAMGMGLLYGMLTAVMVFIMMSAFLPTMISTLGLGKGNDAANCAGYIDTDSTTALGGTNNKSYDSSLETDSITCSILDFTPGMFVLAIVFAIIAGIISGRMGMAQQEPQYGYQQQY